MRAAAGLALAVCALGAGTATAYATSASETITAGSLSFINATPGNITFPGTTLNGSDQVKTQGMPIDISDATGSASGWSVTATSTTFTSGANTLPLNATTIQSAPTDVCDAASTCALATNGVSYPFSLPAAAVSPTALKMYNAAANTGLGAQTITPTWSLAVPATARVGTYNSTWTLTLVSGP